MPTHALITHPTSRKTTLQTIEVVLHPITIISLVNSLERFQASLFITR
jgi:hypothetical protein